MARPAAVKTGEFDASQYLTRVSGQDYLEVKWRLVWMRKEHPDAQVVTELVSHTPGVSRDAPGSAVFRATVTLPTGGVGTGYGSETSGDFRDYLEKAETKAIGRALGSLGFGTQFSGFDFSEVVVDAPVSTAKASQPTTPTPQPQPEPAPQVETREELLAGCLREQSRLGADKILEWMAANTKDAEGKPKTKRSQMTDDDLRRLLAWAQTVS